MKVGDAIAEIMKREGIEILWSWPDTLPLSTKGYDILRIEGRELRWTSQCETIAQPQITVLRAHGEIAAPCRPDCLRANCVLPREHLDALHLRLYGKRRMQIVDDCHLDDGIGFHKHGQLDPRGLAKLR